MSLPNIFKHFSSNNKAEAYVFPDISGPQPEAGEKKTTLTLIDFAAEFAAAEAAADEAERVGMVLEDVTGEPEPETEPEQEIDPIDETAAQIEEMLRAAEEQAAQIIEKAREEAKAEAERIYEEARESGREDGYREGTEQALAEGRLEQEKFAAKMQEDVDKFLEQAGVMLDRQLDENVNELRDLAIAIAEKVVCISLRSSTEIIGRMVQAALDKRKHREWIHIYISESDAKRMSQIPASLTAAVSGISDRVRIIPMQDDDSGTLVIEMPDEIIDASASTQLGNIRGLLSNSSRQTESDLNSFGSFGNFGF